MIVAVIASLLDQLVLRVSVPDVARMVVHAPSPDRGSADSIAPQKLAVIRELLANISQVAEMRDGVAHADVRAVARLLGWLHRDADGSTTVTADGTRLLETVADTSEEAAVFAAAILENAPLCTVAGALLLGEWLELRNLAPALARELDLSTAQAARLAPCVLAWRDEVRAHGWTTRQAALHLRSRTAWMRALSVRTRDLLARIGIVTRERVTALDPATLRDRPGFRADVLREIEKFQAELTPAPRAAAVRTPPPQESVAPLLRKIGSSGLSTRAQRVLRDLGAICVGDVVALERGALLQQPQCGRGTVDEIEAWLAGLGLALRPTAVAAVVEAPTESLADAVHARAVQLAARRGCVSIGALARECSDLGNSDLDALRDLLDEAADVRWIDEDRAWLWIAEGPRTGLVARLEALLDGTARMSPMDLRSELLKTASARADVPPASVLAALCEQLGHGEQVREPEVDPIVEAKAAIDGDTSVGDLARAAGMSLAELVALALSDAGREPPRRQPRR